MTNEWRDAVEARRAMPADEWLAQYMGSWQMEGAWVTNEGMVRCACEEWAIKRQHHPHHCEHTDELRKEKRLHFIDVGPYYFVNDHWITDRKVPANAKTWDESLLVKFRRLVQYVSAIPAWERYLAAPLIERVRFPIESAVLLDKCAPSIKSQFIAVSNDLHRLLMEGMPPEEEKPDEVQTLPRQG